MMMSETQQDGQAKDTNEKLELELENILAILQKQINTTIAQTNIISMIKQLLIKAISQFLQMCRNIRIKFLSWAYMYTILSFLGQLVIQTNPSKFDERLEERDRDRERKTERQRQRDKG